MKALSIAAIIALSLSLSFSLGACATKPGEDPMTAAKRQVLQIEFAYAGIRSTAVACAAGLICKDEGVIAAIKTALPTADLAVDEGTKLILANATDGDAVTKGLQIARKAIDVLTQVLVSFGVKL